MDEQTRKEIQDWLRTHKTNHHHLAKGIELILRVLLEKEGL